MEEFQIFEVTFFNLSPCAAQRYRGSAHRARGLVLQKNPMCFFFNPSLRRCRSSVSPLYCCATQGRRGKYNPIQFAKLMWQKIAIPTFLLPHYISHFLNLLKQLRRRKYSTPQYPIYIVTILSISPFTLRLI